MIHKIEPMIFNEPCNEENKEDITSMQQPQQGQTNQMENTATDEQWIAIKICINILIT